MPSTIPTFPSYRQIAPGPRRRRFLGTGSSYVPGVLTGTRQQRAAVNELDPMSSVAGPIAAGVSARDAQFAVYKTWGVGERLTV